MGGEVSQRAIYPVRPVITRQTIGRSLACMRHWEFLPVPESAERIGRRSMWFGTHAVHGLPRNTAYRQQSLQFIRPRTGNSNRQTPQTAPPLASRPKSQHKPLHQIQPPIAVPRIECPHAIIAPICPLRIQLDRRRWRTISTGINAIAIAGVVSVLCLANMYPFDRGGWRDACPRAGSVDVQFADLVSRVTGDSGHEDGASGCRLDVQRKAALGDVRITHTDAEGKLESLKPRNVFRGSNRAACMVHTELLAALD